MLFVNGENTSNFCTLQVYSRVQAHVNKLIWHKYLLSSVTSLGVHNIYVK
jgi:hypothetical protein